jgi:hypothetical protein
LTLQDFGYLCEKLNRDREKIQPIDVALGEVKQLLISGFGIKIEKKPKSDGLQKDWKSIGSVSFTTAEKDAWIKAGMPEINKFLKDLRNGR